MARVVRHTGCVRVLALDLGTKRIGVAVSDGTGTIASPYEVVIRSGEVARDHRRLLELIEETEAVRVVVGLPLSLDGSVGPAAQGALDEVAVLAELVDVPVETFDERLTTVTAHQLLADQGLSSKSRREIVDKAAAAVLLQTWLESPARQAAEAEAAEARAAAAIEATSARADAAEVAEVEGDGHLGADVADPDSN